MKDKLKSIRKNVVKWKIYIDRARMYVNYINFVMIIFLFVDSLKNYEFTQSWMPTSTVGLIILIPIFFLLSLLLGYFDTKFGVHGEEAKQNTLKNPVMNEILERLDRIEKKMK